MTRLPKTFVKSAAPLLGIATLLLVLAAPAVAAGPASSLALLGVQSPAAFLFGAAPVAKKDPIGDPSSQSYCVAQCLDGTTVRCDGSPCTAVDGDCSTGEVGYCTSPNGRQDCQPICCSGTTSCSDKYGTPCTGHGGSSCTSSDGSCGSCLCDPGSHTWICTL